MDHGRTPTAPSTPLTATAPTFPLYSTRTDIKQRRHSTPHLGDGVLLSHRLAVLAPKGERGLSGPGHHSNNNTSSTVRLKNLSRPDGVFKEKLPPRSRTGCWTCRTRKVKCDEEHPRCGQCVRLQHQCDYSPRLSFRDDTPRIIERMQEVSTEGSAVWDPRFKGTRRLSDRSPDYPASGDALPPFSELTNDEDREMKALTRIPGTFNLVCNPNSFINAEDFEEAIEDSPTSSVGPAVKQDSEKKELSLDSLGPPKNNIPVVSSSESGSDPDIVILRRFEEPVIKRVPNSSSSKENLRKASLVSASGAIPMLSELEIVSPVVGSGPRLPSPNSILRSHNNPVIHKPVTPNDSRYLQYFSEVISPKLFQFGGLGQSIADQRNSFEREAMRFPPLFNAMMALSALSLNQREGNISAATSLDASQHCQLVLSALQMNLSSPTDFSSDGTLFTHFFLLLYEIAAVEFGRPSLWPQQLPQFKGLLLARLGINKEENELVTFVTWYLIILDVYTALSAGGDGELVDSLIKNALVPDIRRLFDNNKASTSSPTFVSPPVPHFRDVEKEVFLHFLSLFQRLILAGGSLARLCRAIRRALPSIGGILYTDVGIAPGQLDISLRQSQVEQELESLREIWRDHERQLEILDPNQQNTTSMRVNAVYEQCEIFYQTCVLFGQTSMWASQRQTMTDEAMLEVNASIQLILTLTQSQQAVRGGSTNLGLLVFPLFLAGCASTSGSEKMWVLELFGPLEDGSVSRASFAVKEALQVIYQRQNEEMMNLGHNMGVDWQSVLKDLGTQIVSFGF